MKKLLLSLAALGMLVASTAAQAHSREYYENKYYQEHGAYYPAPDYNRYGRPPNYYPASCYYVHEDSLGHHTWRVRPACSQPQPRYYAPYVPPRPSYYDYQYRDYRGPRVQLNLYND